MYAHYCCVMQNKRNLRNITSLYFISFDTIFVVSTNPAVILRPNKRYSSPKNSWKCPLFTVIAEKRCKDNFTLRLQLSKGLKIAESSESSTLKPNKVFMSYKKIYWKIGKTSKWPRCKKMYIFLVSDPILGYQPGAVLIRDRISSKGFLSYVNRGRTNTWPKGKKNSSTLEL